MPTLKMRTTTRDRENSALLMPTIDAIPAVSGNGDLTYLCSGCDLRLIESISPGEVENVVIQCPFCGSFSEI